MIPGPRAVIVTSMIAAVVVFCGVQDRITAAGAERYVLLQRAALAGRGPAVTVDQIMRPAVARSVREGLLWGGSVMAAGLGIAGATARRRRSS